jgi:hypothetical protein
MKGQQDIKDTIIAFLVLVILALVIAALVVGKRKGVIFSPSQELSDREIIRVLRGLGDNVLLPDEEPAIARINDVEQLQAAQGFYKDAITDDYLVLFPENALAIIYRLQEDIIINIGPIQVPESALPNEAVTGEVTVEE